MLRVLGAFLNLQYHDYNFRFEISYFIHLRTVSDSVYDLLSARVRVHSYCRHRTSLWISLILTHGVLGREVSVAAQL